MMNLSDSNKYIVELIKNSKEKPFTITRLGSESYPSYLYITKRKFIIPSTISNNAGIYSNNQNEIAIYYINYNNAVETSDGLAIYLDLPGTSESEKYFLEAFKKRDNFKFLIHEVLEPFHCISQLPNEKPWSHYLLGKKVLIISPFVDSFQKQLKNGFRMFKDTEKNIFLEGQEFVFYKCFNTVAGNHPHKSWIETFNIMCNDIIKLDFDIALVSCGGYGLLIGSFIKRKMNKSSIYVGGGLQLFFGVMGRRWMTNPTIQNIIKDNINQFIRPSKDEIPQNCQTVEGGCYW
jgi:hypothetical protein